MKALNIKEVAELAKSLSSAIACRLQNVESGENWVSFMFYGRGEEKHFTISLSPQLPIVLPLEAPRQHRRKTIPIQLFLRAHFENHFLSKVLFNEGDGRVITLEFSNQAQLEVRLYPHGQNLIARTADGKRISYDKVHESQLISLSSEQVFEVRTVEQLLMEWLQSTLQKPAGVDEKSIQARRDKLLQKKIRASEVLKLDLESKKKAQFRDVGEWLKAHQHLNVSAAWAGYIDPELSFAANLNLLFKKAKLNDEKIRLAEKRLEQINSEIKKIEAGDIGVALSSPQSLIQDAEARGRTFQLTDGLHFYVGRNAQENLKILRAAQAWDLWCHIQDRPGSHGILKRNKNQKISDKSIEESLQFLLRSQFGAKSKNYLGDSFSCIVAECRFVRPIKGDRLGRVHYQNERVFRIRFKG